MNRQRKIRAHFVSERIYNDNILNSLYFVWKVKEDEEQEEEEQEEGVMEG